MIQLRPDCLIIRTSAGEQIPCPAEWLTLELLGDVALGIEPEQIQHASAAVLHYFKHERAQDFVSVGEFAQALEKVLRQLGLTLGSRPSSSRRIVEMDLQQFARNAGEGRELFFFPRLREELKRQLEGAPDVVRLCGLRPCVKELTGAKSWNRRCQTLNDQIVEYLRTCWHSESRSQSCALVVQ